MSDSDEPELLIQRSGPVVTLVLNRPARRNALSWTLIRSLRAALADIRTDADARVVVVTGSGDKAFCAGADLGSMGGEGVLELHDARGELAGLFEDLWSLGRPTVAKVRGYCLAGGFGLALSCDLVVSADDAVFGTPEIGVGLWPFMITVPMLRAMPSKRALELMMTGRRVGAAEGERWGFLNRVVATGDLDHEVDDLAASLATASPAVMRVGRDSFYSVCDQPASAALPQLHALLSLAVTFDDAAEGIAAFAEKRPPRFSGR